MVQYITHGFPISSYALHSRIQGTRNLTQATTSGWSYSDEIPANSIVFQNSVYSLLETMSTTQY